MIQFTMIDLLLISFKEVTEADFTKLIFVTIISCSLGYALYQFLKIPRIKYYFKKIDSTEYKSIDEVLVNLKIDFGGWLTDYAIFFNDKNYLIYWEVSWLKLIYFRDSQAQWECKTSMNALDKLLNNLEGKRLLFFLKDLISPNEMRIYSFDLRIKLIAYAEIKNISLNLTQDW